MNEGLDCGLMMEGEGAGKDLQFTKHGHDWRVRTVENTALATIAHTRAGERTPTMGGGYSVTVMLLDADGKVVRDTEDKPIPYATGGFSIEQDSLAAEGFDTRQKHLERVHELIDDASSRVPNVDGFNSWVADFVTKPEELAAPAGERPPIGMLPDLEPVLAVVAKVGS